MIQSFMIQHAVGNVGYVFYDSVLDGKHVYTACGVGRAERNDARLTETARETLLALTDYAENASGRERSIRLQEIATVKAAPVRVRKALESADHEDIVFFVCRTADIYDAAVAELGVQWIVPGGKQ